MVSPAFLARIQSVMIVLFKTVFAAKLLLPRFEDVRHALFGQRREMKRQLKKGKYEKKEEAGE